MAGQTVCMCLRHWRASLSSAVDSIELFKRFLPEERATCDDATIIKDSTGESVRCVPCKGTRHESLRSGKSKIKPG